MNEPAVPFAAGVHLPWAGVPLRVQQWAAVLGGGAPVQVSDLAGGFSPGATSRLAFTAGPDIFIKAVGAELNPESPSMHRREAAIAGALPEALHWPRLIDIYDDGNWIALAFEAVEGELPRHPWSKSQLDTVLGALERMHGELTPNPVSDVATSAAYRQHMFGCWQEMANETVVPSALDRWSRDHLDQLADLEAAWAAASEGATLIHGDLRSDNILLWGDHAVFVDWPHASVGSAALDLVAWAPSVRLEGGPEPEELLARYGPSRRFDADQVTVLVAAVAGFLTAHALWPDPPGLPTLRAFQAAQADVARAWLRQRTGW